jgi:hypothetical protein
MATVGLRPAGAEGARMRQVGIYTGAISGDLAGVKESGIGREGSPLF